MHPSERNLQKPFANQHICQATHKQTRDKQEREEERQRRRERERLTHMECRTSGSVRCWSDHPLTENHLATADH